MPLQTALGNVGITKSAVLSPAPATARAEVREVCKSCVALAKIVLSEITADLMLRQALLSTSLSAPDRSSGDKAKPLEQDPDHLLGDCTAKKCISGPRRAAWAACSQVSVGDMPFCWLVTGAGWHRMDPIVCQPLERTGVSWGNAEALPIIFLQIFFFFFHPAAAQRTMAEPRCQGAGGSWVLLAPGPGDLCRRGQRTGTRN